MSFFKDAYQKLKDQVFGRESDTVELPESTVDSEGGLDIGPAKKWYVKRMFPKAVFTQELTPAREMQIRDVFRRMRPEQKAIARRHGWNRGLDV